MIVLNKRGGRVNFLHFCGQSLKEFPSTIKYLYRNTVLGEVDNDITLISCWTQDMKCMLYQQLRKNKIQLNNCIPKQYDFSQPWYMPFKICYILTYLMNHVSTPITAVLDGYDVLMVSSDDLKEKFINQKYNILFNATPNNYPDIDIDFIPNREDLGLYKYFNAGCCIGYTKDLIYFYSKVLEYINYPNPYGSEQYLMRLAFAEYSDKPEQSFIGIDTNCDIFNCMALTTASVNPENRLLN